MKWGMLISLGLSVLAARAQISPFEAAASAGAYGKGLSNALCVRNNPASLGMLEQQLVGLYSESRFGLSQLTSFQFVFCKPLEFGGIAAGFRYEGSSDQNIIQPAFAWGKDIGRLAVGAYLSYAWSRIRAYEDRFTPSVKVGVLMKISENVVWGISVFKSGLTDIPAEPTYTRCDAAIGCRASENFYMSIQWSGYGGSRSDAVVHLRYMPAPHLFTGLSISYAALQPIIQTGWIRRALTVCVLIGYHLDLGVSSGLMLEWTLRKRE